MPRPGPMPTTTMTSSAKTLAAAVAVTNILAACFIFISNSFLGDMQHIVFRLMLSSCVCVSVCLCVCRVCGRQENGVDIETSIFL